MRIHKIRCYVRDAVLLCALLVFASHVLTWSPAAWAADAPAKSATKPADKPAKVDLNTATDKQLQDLPGIGDAYSKKIIAARPLRTTKDLAKLGIPAPTIEKIAPLVTFSQGRPGGKVKPPKKGMVWVNTDTKIYHTEKSPWYGNTKNGTWMTEADAIKAGNKATE
jgi:hypothetical protein